MLFSLMYTWGGWCCTDIEGTLSPKISHVKAATPSCPPTPTSMGISEHCPQAFSSSNSVALVIEDVKTNRKIMKRRLEEIGYQVCTFKQGNRVQKAIQKYQPALIVTDYDLGRSFLGKEYENGLWIREKALQISPNTPVILWTATEDKKLEEFPFYLPKFFKPQDLEGLISRLSTEETPTH